MDKKVTYAIIALLAIVVVVGVAFAVVGNDSEDEKDPDTPDPVPPEPPVETGDTYYIFLDGISADKIGWYTGVGKDADQGYRNALDNSKIPYDINESGWILNIDGLSGGDKNGFAVFGYTSTKADSMNPYNFQRGPVLTSLDVNIAYVSYGAYTMDPVTYYTTYDLVPTTTKAASLSEGPFKDPNYKSLEYANTYSFYLDGICDKNMWIEGTGATPMEGFKAALDNNQIPKDINEKGWVLSINGVTPDSSKNQGFFFSVYLKDGLKDASGYDFAEAGGASLTESVGEIFYVSLATYVVDGYNWTQPNPSPTNTTADFLTSGPFAAKA